MPKKNDYLYIFTLKFFDVGVGLGVELGVRVRGGWGFFILFFIINLIY